MKSNKRYTLDDCKNILGKDKTIFIASTRFWREFEKAVNRDIVNEQQKL